ncbi:hypothetical protein BGZ58_010762 [Dissophora ornata]|nr:hypothetical protein BGZ58_010762 [Dissophora ornata]
MHPPSYAVVFIGNAGSGKSTLLTQIGGSFGSGTVFRRGYTKDVTEKRVTLNGEQVVLMDVPGLFEPNNKETGLNAEKLTMALNRPYNFKLFFVLRAGNSGPDNEDMVMMAKVNECVRKVGGARVTFRVIVNQIINQQVYDMYKEEIVKDNFQKRLSALNIDGFSFNINIDHTILLWFNSDEVKQNALRDTITREIAKHTAVPLAVTDISFTKGNLEMYQKGFPSTESPVKQVNSEDSAAAGERQGWQRKLSSLITQGLDTGRNATKLFTSPGVASLSAPCNVESHTGSGDLSADHNVALTPVPGPRANKRLSDETPTELENEQCPGEQPDPRVAGRTVLVVDDRPLTELENGECPGEQPDPRVAGRSVLNGECPGEQPDPRVADRTVLVADSKPLTELENGECPGEQPDTRVADRTMLVVDDKLLTELENGECPGEQPDPRVADRSVLVADSKPLTELKNGKCPGEQPDPRVAGRTVLVDSKPLTEPKNGKCPSKQPNPRVADRAVLVNLKHLGVMERRDKVTVGLSEEFVILELPPPTKGSKGHRG